MGNLAFSLNLTLDGCVDHLEGIADDETHAFFTQLMDDHDAMLWGRATYEMMEAFWPSVASGATAAPPAIFIPGSPAMARRYMPMAFPRPVNSS